jgi:hypothetical protein
LRFDANFALAHYQLGVLLGKQNEMPRPGPSLHVLIKLLATVTLVLAPPFL